MKNSKDILAVKLFDSEVGMFFAKDSSSGNINKIVYTYRDAQGNLKFKVMDVSNDKRKGTVLQNFVFGELNLSE